MSAEADPLFRAMGPLTQEEADMLAVMRVTPAPLRTALMAAMERRVAGEPWRTAISSGFKDAGWSDAAAAPEIARMLSALDTTHH